MIRVLVATFLVAVSVGTSSAQPGHPPEIPLSAPAPDPGFEARCTEAFGAKFDQEKQAAYRKLDEDSRVRHDADARLIATNKRHVVMAYAAIWILAVGFLLVLWRRQGKLTERIAQLGRELDEAVRKDRA